jgi:hypothetical protein
MTAEMSADPATIGGTAFHYTPDDFVAAQRLHGLPTRGVVLRWVALAVAGFVLAFEMTESWSEAAQGFGIVFGVVAGAFVVYYLLVTPLLARRQLARYPLAQLEQTMSLGKDGVTIKTPRGATELQWRDLQAWRANEKVVLLYPAPRLFYVVPKRIAADGFPIEDLRAALERTGPAGKFASARTSKSSEPTGGP